VLDRDAFIAFVYENIKYLQIAEVKYSLVGDILDNYNDIPLRFLPVCDVDELHRC
jgi:hypothetical protein